MKRNWQTPALLGAMMIGLIFPQLHVLSFLVRYAMMAMLFFAYLNLRAENVRLRRAHALLLIAAPTMGFAVYFILRPFSADLALAAFLVCLTPTATASPVVTGLLGGDPAFPALMVFASSILHPLIISAALPFIGHGKAVTGIAGIMVPLLSTMLIPLCAALAVRRFSQAATEKLRALGSLSFALWVAALAVVIATAADFIYRSRAPISLIVSIAAVSLVLCIINFTLGRLAGGADRRIEGGQAMGQKNTVFTIWVALSFLNPMVALGPTFYIFWHNAWNAVQLHRHAKAGGN